MKRLCLMRHAKSDWSDPSLPDAERVLNKRGRRVADFMAGYIFQQGMEPDVVLCSTARRAVATVAPLAEKCPTLRVIYRDTLYMAMPEQLLDIIRDAPADAETLLVVAHNPGLGLLASFLSQSSADQGARGKADDGAEAFPTGALAVFDLDIAAWRDLKTWGKLASHCVRPVIFARPRLLMATD